MKHCEDAISFPEFNPLHSLLLLPDILISRFLCSVTHHGGDKYDTSTRFHAVLLDHVNRGLLHTWKLCGYLPEDYSYLLSFHNLESFILDSNYGTCNVLEVLDSLAPLQTLKHLSLRVWSRPSNRQNMLKNACPALMELSISGNCDWMLQVLDSLAGGCIKIVTIDNTLMNFDPTDFIGIYWSLARFSSLQKISHTWGNWNDTPGDAYVEYLTKIDIVPIIIYPISRLIHLECLEFASGYPFTEDIISALATTFPTLKELSISSSAIAGRPTLNSLCILASNCPNLTWLTISLDVKTIPSNVIPAFCHLQHLHIEAEWENTPSVATTAVFFDTLFPYLRCFKSSPYYGCYENGDSKVLETILTICQPARKAEKERLLHLKGKS